MVVLTPIRSILTRPHDFALKYRLARLARLAPAVERELREAQERRRSYLVEAALQDSQERLRLLAEHLQDVIFRFGLVPDAGIDYISPAVTTGHRLHPTSSAPAPICSSRWSNRKTEPDSSAPGMTPTRPRW
ncbi:MAG: hypothetical protein QOE03_2728 [Micromonosporaceae bacterium]|nr:hypothetical protein [Micromonosporaceae bacterium]